MSLYRVTPDKLESVPRTTFAVERLMERKDLQRFLRQDNTAIAFLKERRNAPHLARATDKIDWQA